MVAVAEISTAHGKSPGQPGASRNASKTPGRLRGALISLCVALAWGALPSAVQANPTGGVAIQGQATFSTNGSQLRVITQNGAGLNHSAIDWQSFSIPTGSSTYFQQPTAASTSINRVVTSTPSLLFGTLGSNGNLVLVNQSGITVGAGAVVDTAGFTASALRMSDADALSGRLRFGDASAAPGAVSVMGNVLAHSGDIYLLGSSVDTGGSALVQAPNGSTVLAAGQQIEITGRGLEGIVLRVQAPADSAVNLGTLKGDAVGVFAGTLKHSGLIQATTATLDGGKVVLRASGETLLQGNSQTLASSANAEGGEIHILGNHVGLTDNAVVDASGATGGGTVLVGGDYQGKNSAVQNANVSYVGPQTTIKADATGSGNGGKVIVWADDTARAYGSLSAQGGATGGDGGLVETSGHRYLEVAGARVNTLAAQGQTGNWLLDPTDITIVQGPLSEVNPLDTTGLFNVGTGAGAPLTDGDINAQMYNTNITVQTASAASDAGDIVFDSTAGAISIRSDTMAQSGRSLVLNADRNIVFRGANGTTFAGTAQPLTVQLTPLSALGKIVTEGSAKVTANGTANATVMQVAAGKAWENFGTLNLEGDATVALHQAATFHNKVGAVGNLGSSFKAFSSPANVPTTSDGLVRNDGTLNVKNSTTIEAEYSQTGTLNIEGFSLNLTNAKSVSGVIDLAPTGASQAGTLNVVGNQGSVAQFHDLNIRKTVAVTSTAELNVRAGSSAVSASFSNVVAPGVALGINFNSDTSELATVTISDGVSTFDRVNPDQYNPWALAINSGTLGLTTGGLSVSSNNITLTGNVGLYAGGALNLQSAFTTTGNLHFISGWNGDLATPAAKAGGPWAAPLTVSGALSAAKLGLESSDSVVLNEALTVTGSLDIRARAGSIAPTVGNQVQTYALHVTGATKLNASGNVDLADASNTFNSLEVSALGSVNIAAASGLSLGNVSGSSVTLDAAGAITQGASQSITSTGQQYSNSGNGGDVNVYGASLALGTINASGVTFCTDAGCANGGSGGAVLLHAKSGNFSGTIISRGGDGGTNGGNGGAGGAVSLVMNGVVVNGATVANSGVASLSTNTFQTQGGTGTTVGSITGVNGTAGTWRVYADSPVGVSKGGLTSDFRLYNTSYNTDVSIPATGNGFIYASAPGTLQVDTTLLSGAASNTYGNNPDAVLGYSLSGFADNEDNAGNVGLTGVAEFGPDILASTNAASYTRSYVRGFSNTLGYAFAARNGLAYTVNQRPITVTTSSVTKNYDGGTSAAGTTLLSGGSLFSNDSLSGGSFAFTNRNAGFGSKTVNVSGVTVTDGNAGNNYLVTYAPNTSSTINTKIVVLTAPVVSKTYDGNVFYTASTTDLAAISTVLVGGDTVIAAGLTFGDKNFGVGNKTVSLTSKTINDGNGGGNYAVFLADNTTSTINKASVTFTAPTISKTYDGTASYTTTAADLSTLSGVLLAGDTVSAATLGYGDRNVGAGNKSVFIASALLNDGNNGNNYNVSFVGNASSTITRAALANWTGGTSGLWSAASNWSALPDGNNVLAVSIPSGTVVTFDSGVVDTTLQTLTNLGSLQVTGGNLAIVNALNTSAYSQSGGTVSGAGTFTVTNSFSQSAGSIAMGGAVSVVQASGNLAVNGGISGASIALDAPTGAISQTVALSSAGLLKVRAANGVSLTNSGNAVSAFEARTTAAGDVALTNGRVLNPRALDVKGVTVFDGNLTIDNTGALVTMGAIDVGGGDVRITTHSPLTIGNTVNADGSITLSALTADNTSNIVINGAMASASGGISVQAYNNFIQNAGLSAALAIDVAAGGVVTFGPNATSLGNPVSYKVDGATYLPPWIASTLSGGATDFVVAFLDQFQAVLDEQQLAVADDPFGIEQRKSEGVVVEGEICKP